MIGSETPYKLSEIIQDTWPMLYRPPKDWELPAQIPIDKDCKEV